jgi:hypothetical protein
MTNELPNLTDLLQARKYNPAQRPASQQPIFTIQSKVVATLQSYIIFSGLPKAGKSSFVSAAAASALIPPYQGIWGMKLQLPTDRPRIGYFDTEMSDFDFYRQIDKILALADKRSLPSTFDAFSLREDMPGRIRAMIEQYLIDHSDCACIIVDGLLDLCLNYNSEEETRRLTNWFKRITKQYNVLMIGVLHLGKGQGETLGHLGSNTDRWAQSTMIVEKNKEAGQFVLKPKYLRSSDDFDPVAIMNFNGLWQQVPYIQQETITLPKKQKKS